MWRSLRRGLRRPALEVVAVLLSAVVWTAPLGGQVDAELEYQDRGDRYEGLMPRPVSDFDVELLAAQIATEASITEWPETLGLAFYLPKTREPIVAAAGEVFITVRQKRPGTVFYRLDRVRPKSPWQVGAFNVFTWPSFTVLRREPSIRADELGTVVRLGSRSPGNREVVAPALLFGREESASGRLSNAGVAGHGSRIPPLVTEYRFTLRTTATTRLTCQIYRGSTRVGVRPEELESKGSRFTFAWDSSEQPDGWYRLVIEGKLGPESRPIAKEFFFYHEATLPVDLIESPR